MKRRWLQTKTRGGIIREMRMLFILLVWPSSVSRQNIISGNSRSCKWMPTYTAYWLPKSGQAQRHGVLCRKFRFWWNHILVWRLMAKEHLDASKARLRGRPSEQKQLHSKVQRQGPCCAFVGMPIGVWFWQRRLKKSRHNVQKTTVIPTLDRTQYIHMEIQ